MAKRGRKPKPTAVKRLAGNPGRRPLNEEEPQPEPAELACPPWLDPEAGRLWGLLAPELHRLGVLTKLDTGMLATYCRCWSQYLKCQEMLDKTGPIFVAKNDDGSIKFLQPMPQIGIAQKMLTQMRQLGAELGLSPSSRSALKIAPAVDGDQAEDAFFD